ncbi:hypothetical protein C6A87_002480 [Mycobacterium sp. ITM-2016-00317]|uniref:hypothetical protein n=1 Tax=Mycobacterium sp. ITM-2016-00317 TaxID=2099694 RepID=UPI000D411B30|nr:hypothetical protein [Mycobacterium sp. ITM-2016-00317]WNG88148.1 hypothetical protein C6A87_002480 [Mycobacterium sp. ITM-2016-00317]
MQDEQLGAARLLGPRQELQPNGWVVPTRLKEIPYDHVAVFTLAGRRGARVEDVINVSVDGVFIATSIGYSFVPAEPAGPVVFSLPDVNQLLAGLFDDPRIGLRALAAKVFGIDFTYSIIDSGTGRELQNRSLHNIAGLGSPDGRRPFRPMAKPMLFQPRSTIRVVVDEISAGPLYERGQLFIALHGYKILGTGM